MSIKQQHLELGIFSICLILVLSIFILRISPAFDKECSVSMVLYNEDLDSRFTYSINDFVKSRNFIEYELTGNSVTDINTFEKYKNNVSSIAMSNDTLDGIRFKFNQQTTYQRFIDAFDICFIKNASYIYYKNDLWIVSNSVENSRYKHLFHLSSYDKE